MPVEIVSDSETLILLPSILTERNYPLQLLLPLLKHINKKGLIGLLGLRISFGHAWDCKQCHANGAVYQLV
jgi:hypothetical protein